MNKSGCKFVAGNSLSLADYVIFSELQDTKYASMDMSDYARLMKYQDDVMGASPAFHAIHTGDDWLSLLPMMANGLFKLPAAPEA